MNLTPCTQCNRHARASDGSCPFCGGALTKVAQVPVPDRRMSRAALVAFGATLASGLVATGCGSDDDGGGGSGGSGATAGSGGNSGSGGTSGGAGQAGASGSAGTAGQGGFGGIAPAYGLPADAGGAGGTAGGTAGAAPAYGLPPDAG